MESNEIWAKDAQPVNLNRSKKNFAKRLSRAHESKIARKNPKMLKKKNARDEEKKHGRIQDKKHTKITVNKMNRNPKGQKEDSASIPRWSTIQKLISPSLDF